MSRTDKTRPEWVQYNDPHNKRWRAESHHHHGRECDIENYNPRIGYRSSRCHVWPSQEAISAGVYGRRKGVKYYEWDELRRERAKWRRIKGRVLKGDIDACEESPVGQYSHRHSALWLAW